MASIGDDICYGLELVEACRVTRSRKEDLVTRHTYEVRVIGSLGPAAHEAFAGMTVKVEPPVTVVSGDLDQPGRVRSAALGSLFRGDDAAGPVVIVTL
jgi:hypothetical protein